MNFDPKNDRIDLKIPVQFEIKVGLKLDKGGVASLLEEDRANRKEKDKAKR